MKNVVIYIRVSSDEQALKGNSLADQRDKLEKYCEQKGYHIVAHYQEDYSAKTFDRPVFKSFLEFIKRNKNAVDELLVIRWDRFSRNALEAYVMIERLSKYNIEVISVEQPLDMSIPENKLLLGIYLTAPEVENLRRGKNTFNGIRRAMKDGRYVSAAPYGYRFEENENKRPILVHNAQKAEFVKEAFEKFATGLYTKEELRRLLANKGLKIEKNAFGAIFHNPLYCGKIVVKAYENEPETIVQGVHKPIVSEDLFYQVQDIYFGKKRNLPKRYTTKEELPLRGYLICPLCGGNITGSASTSRSKAKVFYYHCQKGCKTRFNASKANSIFSEWLNEISIKPEYVDTFLTLFDTIYKQEEGDRKLEQRRIETQLKECEEKMLKADMKFVEDTLDKESYQRIKASYNQDYSRLKSQLIENKSIDKDLIHKIERAFELISNLGQFYGSADLHGKQKLLGSIFPQKLNFDGTKYRTSGPNEIIELMFLVNNDLAKLKKDKSGYKPNLSSLVLRRGVEPLFPP